VKFFKLTFSVRGWRCIYLPRAPKDIELLHCAPSETSTCHWTT